MEPYLKGFICFRVSSNLQPIALVIELNHIPADRNVIRNLAAGGLKVGVPHPIVYGGATAIDTQTARDSDEIRQRRSSDEQLDTQLHRGLGCRLSSHES